MRIGFLGLSHLGIVSSIATAMKGFKVVSFDANLSKIKDLENNRINFSEPDIIKNLKKYKKNLLFTNSIDDLNICEIIYISLDLTVNEKGRANYKLLENLLEIAKSKLSKNKILVILSQVKPGFTRKLQWNKNKLFYQVETLIFGSALSRALNPERIIIGKNSENSKVPNSFLKYLKKFKSPIIQMSYESAELTKISVNLFLISNISLTNMLSNICEKIDASWSDLSSAIKLDKRIGKYAYLNPGFGLTGVNLIRDLSSIKSISKNNFLPTKLFDSYLFLSEFQKKWVLKKIQKYLKKNKQKKRIGILGLSYKENTSSTKNSPALYILNKLKGKFKFNVYDPEVKLNLEIKNKKIYTKKNILSVIKNSSLIFITVPWKEFFLINKLDFNYFVGKTIIDPNNIINNQKILNSCNVYCSLGRSDRVNK